MTLTVEQRRAKAMLERQLAEITAPERKAKRQALAKGRQERRKAIGKTAAGQRKPREHDKAYLAHTRLQPCLLAGLEGEACHGRSDPAHLRYSNYKVGRTNPGAGNKSDDRWVLPLCRKHHEEQHAAGNEPRWWAGKGIDPDAECIARFEAFATARRGAR